jgi:hypothetical protein
MKRTILLSILALALVGCDAQTSSPPSATSTATPQATVSSSVSPETNPTDPPDASDPLAGQTDVPTIGEFTLDQLSDRGCGMTLWKPDRESRDRFIFFNSINPGSMEMMIDGQMVRFNRIAASGEEFYGQQTSQTFRSEDGTTTVKVDVDLGMLGEIESIAIDEAIVNVNKDGQDVTLTLLGDAGC